MYLLTVLNHESSADGVKRVDVPRCIKDNALGPKPTLEDTCILHVSRTLASVIESEIARSVQEYRQAANEE